MIGVWLSISSLAFLYKCCFATRVFYRRDTDVDCIVPPKLLVKLNHLIVLIEYRS